MLKNVSNSFPPTLLHYTHSTIVQIPFLGIGANWPMLWVGVPSRIGIGIVTSAGVHSTCALQSTFEVSLRRQIKACNKGLISNPNPRGTTKAIEEMSQKLRISVDQNQVWNTVEAELSRKCLK